MSQQRETPGPISARMQINHYCWERGWDAVWYAHPGIPGSVFLCIRWGDAPNQYREFLGYDPNADLAWATELAAGKALAYFENNEPQSPKPSPEKTKAMWDCLDAQLDSIQDGIRAYHAAKANGKTTAQAEEASHAAQQTTLRERLEVFMALERQSIAESKKKYDFEVMAR